MGEKVAVIGAQWGDEGKGKVVDFLSEDKDIVARYSGGTNAGHTIVINNKQYILHLIPSGIFRRETVCVMGNGMVIDPEAFIDEVEGLRREGVEVSPDNLVVSESAHVIFPFHKKLDTLTEVIKGGAKIGTTKKGIGPTYADKAARFGIRICDLKHPELLREKLEFVLQVKNLIIKEFYGEEGYDINDIFDSCMRWGEFILPFARNATYFMKEAIKEGKSILYEGAQGTLLDIDHGTYPYVTSSNPTIGGIMTGLGLPMSAIDKVVGIVKAYTTRVGGGVFPTEQPNEIGNRLREKGGEYGATTGRPRRCGWLDMVALRYAAWLNGFTHIAITKLDVLDSFDEIKVCVAYDIGGEITEEFPVDYELLRQAKPVYKTFKGWSGQVKGVTRYEDLPKEAVEYVEFIASQLDVSVFMVSTGPDRRDTVIWK